MGDHSSRNREEWPRQGLPFFFETRWLWRVPGGAKRLNFIMNSTLRDARVFDNFGSKWQNGYLFQPRDRPERIPAGPGRAWGGL